MIFKYSHDLDMNNITLHTVKGDEGGSGEMAVFLILVILVIAMGVITFLRTRKSFRDNSKKSKNKDAI